MTRELSKQEKEARDRAYEEWIDKDGYTIYKSFFAGFAAALDYRQGQIDDLLAALECIANGHPSTSPGKPELWLSPNEMAEAARAAIAKVRGQ